MMSLHLSYYSLFVVTCSSEQVSSFFACRRFYAIFPTSQMHYLYGQKHFVSYIHNEKLFCIKIYDYAIILANTTFIHISRKLFQIPSISTKTSLRFCTTPICQQRGFILDKQQWRVVQHHELLTHHMGISSILSLMQALYHA